MTTQGSEAWARAQDAADPLSGLRDGFHFPKAPDGSDVVYFAGNSLGLQPKGARRYIEEALEDWARFGVEGHFRARSPWLPYHEQLTASTARLVGALPHEVVVMNTLTVNLHLMMVSFYRPTQKRFRILVEGGAFPSDQYAVQSQVRFHGHSPEQAIVELRPRQGESLLRESDVLETIEREGESLALVMMGSPNYLTGQAFDIAAITRAAHAKGCRVGFDLAHGAGNLKLALHDDGPDFAVWCNYKYLNAGPGGLGGVFVHERHANDTSLPRFAGWWGHDKATRFKMGPEFQPIAGAEGWQLSNPPILQLAALRASMELFDRATMTALREKGDRLTAFLESQLTAIPGGLVEVVTPASPQQRGSQLSQRVKGDARRTCRRLEEAGFVGDFREPDILRISPAPLYCRFIDAHRFAEALKHHAGT